MNLEFIPVKTRAFLPPKDEIWEAIDSLEVGEKDIVFISSKIIAIHQGRTNKVGTIKKEDLIKKEADRYLRYENKDSGYGVNLTVSHGVLISAAGIDESNANGYYILWPEKIDEFCREVRKKLMKKFNLKELGVVATDSHTTPLRWGVTGFAIGLSGVEPTKDIRGEEDIFGRKIKITKIDMIDPLAAMAVNVMGESSERTPILIAKNCQHMIFSDKASMEGFKIAPEMDIYRPLLETLPPVDRRHF